MAEQETSYGAQDIQILEGLEHVRKRPGMYIGSTGPKGLHHLVYEVVDNSVDEALAGFCNQIDVTLNEDGSCTVVDDGRGIPVEEHPKRKNMSTLEVVLTILNAGGKFGGSGYKVSGGLHGVGVSVVNALSSKVVAQVKRDGAIWEMEFSRGKTVQKITEIGKTEKTGTIITFWPDPRFSRPSSSITRRCASTSARRPSSTRASRSSSAMPAARSPRPKSSNTRAALSTSSGT